MSHILTSTLFLHFNVYKLQGFTCSTLMGPTTPPVESQRSPLEGIYIISCLRWKASSLISLERISSEGHRSLKSCIFCERYIFLKIAGELQSSSSSSHTRGNFDTNCLLFASSQQTCFSSSSSSSSSSSNIIQKLFFQGKESLLIFQLIISKAYSAFRTEALLMEASIE